MKFVRTQNSTLCFKLYVPQLLIKMNGWTGEFTVFRFVFVVMLAVRIIGNFLTNHGEVFMCLFCYEKTIAGQEARCCLISLVSWLYVD